MLIHLSLRDEISGEVPRSKNKSITQKLDRNNNFYFYLSNIWNDKGISFWQKQLKAFGLHQMFIVFEAITISMNRSTLTDVFGYLFGGWFIAHRNRMAQTM